MDTEALGRSLLFHDMSAKECTDCLEALDARRRDYARGSFILHAGGRTDRMGLVLSGSVNVQSDDLWGNCTLLSHVGTGEIFAEAYAVLSDQIMPVDVQADEDCSVLFLRAGPLLDILPRAAWKERLIRNLLFISSRKNMALSGRSFHTSPKSARGRILAYLNALSLQKSATELDIPFNRQQMADYLNLERTNLSKELGRMQREGLIRFKKNHFKLLRPDE